MNWNQRFLDDVVSNVAWFSPVRLRLETNWFVNRYLKVGTHHPLRDMLREREAETSLFACTERTRSNEECYRDSKQAVETKRSRLHKNVVTIHFSPGYVVCTFSAERGQELNWARNALNNLGNLTLGSIQGSTYCLPAAGTETRAVSWYTGIYLHTYINKLC